MLPILSGGRLVLPSARARRQPVAYALDCEEHGVTCMMVVPSSLRTLVAMEKLSSPARLDAMRMLINSTGPLDAATAGQFRESHALGIADVMGAREAGTLLQTTGVSADLVCHGGGQPAESLVRLLDADGAPVMTGEVGELHIHSDCLMTGYLPPADSDETAPRGKPEVAEPAPVWFNTGDLARLKADGRIEVVGRSRDIIKAPDGSIVFPVEVEAVLNAADGVVESCVFRAHDETGLEAVGAAVIAESGGDTTELKRSLRRMVRARLGPFKVPKHILVLEDLPRLGRGKPDRNALRTMMEEAIGTPQRAAPRP
jgi:fatty-acyl-CoA synthase